MEPASGGYSWVSGAPESERIWAPSSANCFADDPMRNSITGAKPSSRRRIRSSVHPRTAAVAAVDRQPGQEPVHIALRRDGEGEADLRIGRLIQRSEREPHLGQALVADPHLGDGAELLLHSPRLVGEPRHPEGHPFAAGPVE